VAARADGRLSDPSYDDVDEEPFEEPDSDRMALVPPDPTALQVVAPRSFALEARAFAWALLLAAAAFFALWFFATS